jgi:hypothetical protein
MERRRSNMPRLQLLQYNCPNYRGQLCHKLPAMRQISPLLPPRDMVDAASKHPLPNHPFAGAHSIRCHAFRGDVGAVPTRGDVGAVPSRDGNGCFLASFLAIWVRGMHNAPYGKRIANPLPDPIPPTFFGVQTGKPPAHANANASRTMLGKTPSPLAIDRKTLHLLHPLRRTPWSRI